MNQIVTPPVGFNDHVSIHVSFEEMMLEDPLRLEDLRASGTLSGDQVAYIDQLYAAADAKPKSMWCYETITTGCGQPATLVVVPFLKDGTPSFGAARSVCGNDHCLERMLKRSKMPNEVYAYSTVGLREFMAKHADHMSARKFARLLAKGYGLIAPGTHFNRAALIAFFGVPEVVATTRPQGGEDLAA